MAITATSPDGTEWTVRRAFLRGKDGHGRRIRWRGPDVDALELLRFVEFADMADVPVIGAVGLAIAAVAVVAVVLLFLPAIALGLIQALVVAILFVVAVVAATLFGRPLLVRAEEPSTGASIVWAVQGWGTSTTVRAQVVAAIEAGQDPAAAVGSEATLVARRDALDDAG